MSDVENQSSPEKEEKMDESGDVKPEAESPPKEEPSKSKTPEKTRSPEKTKTPEKSKTPIKKDEKKDDDEEEDEEEEEPPLGLLEQPVVLTSGKREKKKVERLSMTMSLHSSEKKKVEIPEGAGTKLGDCPRVEFKLGHTKAMDLKPLHRLLFNRAGSNTEVKKNIRQFSGFTFKKGDKEYEKRVTSLNKMTMPQLKQMCEVLDIERSGTKPSVVERLMEFLLKPHSSGMKVPQKKKRKSKGDGDKKGTKRKRTSKKDSKAKSKKETVSDISDSDEEEEDEEKEEEEEKSESEAESEEEKAPPKKKSKVEKKEAPKENKVKKQNGKQEKAPKKEKKEAKEASDSDSDDEPLAAKKDEPPSNDELKDVIKKILEGANLEEVTMKTVVKQVYDKYPAFDLTERKDFIKATVKQLIS